MRSTNPVLSKPDAWAQPQFAQGPQQPGQYGYAQEPYGQPVQDPYDQPQLSQPQGVMTIDDVITKTAVTMGVLVLSAALTYLFIPAQLVRPAMIVGGLVAFGVVLLVSFRRKISPAFVLAYSLIEGVFIGALSLVFQTIYPGIVTPAVLGTFVAAGITLAAYKAFRIRVTSQFRKMVIIGTMAYAGVLLLNLVLSFFGINLGIISITGQVSMIALLASAIGVGLAVMNLILDFDYIEQGIAVRAPASESWRGAFGLTVTMVWLYTEILRILSYFRR